MSDATPPSNNPPDRPDRVDAYLSRKAQAGLDPGALVLERVDGQWILTSPSRPPIALGNSFGRAKQALAALISAAGRKG